MTETPPQQEQKVAFWLSSLRLFARRGLMVIIALFVIEMVLFFAVSSLPFLPGEQAAYLNQSKQIGDQFQGASLAQQFWGIFVNNYGIALRELIPGFGLILFGLSLYATARILEVISVQDHASPLVVVLVLLLLFPHSWLELPAYAVATAESIFIVYAVVKWLFDTTGSGIRLRPQLGLFIINFLIVTAMLLVAALFESVEIQIGLLFWVTWIPFAGLIALVVALNRRLMRAVKRSGQAQEARAEQHQTENSSGPV